MKQYLCRVTDNRILWADVQLLTFNVPELARTIRPGQFALARDVTTFDPYLRRMMWFYFVDGNRVAFTLPYCDPLATRARPDNILDLLAPIGHAIAFESDTRHILLIGEGSRVVQLISTAHDAIAHERDVVLISIAASEEFPLHLLSPEIEYRSEDSMNSELIAWADAIIMSGSTELHRKLADAIRAARYRLEPGFARVLVDTPMPCGTGACCACSIDTARGIKFACVDGPTFDLAELEHRRAR